MSRPLPSPATGLPRCPNHHAYVPCPLPRRIGTGACVDCFPIPRGLPQNSGRVGIRIVLFEACSGFTRVTARTLAQPPKAAFVTGLHGTSYPATPPVSYQLNRQLAGWNPPPQVFRAFEAHQRLRTSGPAEFVTSMTISERLLYLSQRPAQRKPATKRVSEKAAGLEQVDPYLEGQYWCPKRRLTRGESRPRTPNWRK